MAFVSLDFNPPPRTLRNFGLIGLVAFSAFAALVHFEVWIFGRLPHAAAYVMGALAAYCGLFALAFPPALKWLYVGMSVVFFPVGLVVSYIIVAIMFFVIITPIGVVMRLAGRDAMRLKFNPQATTYWIKRHPPDTVKRYFRQF